MQRVVDGLEAYFQSIETALVVIFLLALLGDPPDTVAADKALYGLSVRQDFWACRIPKRLGY